MHLPQPGNIASRQACLGSCHCRSVKNGPSILNYCFSISHNLVLHLFIKNCHLPQERIDDKGNHQVVDQHDTDKVEQQEKVSHPLGLCHGLEPNLAFRPVVNDESKKTRNG